MGKRDFGADFCLCRLHDAVTAIESFFLFFETSLASKEDKVFISGLFLCRWIYNVHGVMESEAAS